MSISKDSLTPAFADLELKLENGVNAKVVLRLASRQYKKLMLQHRNPGEEEKIKNIVKAYKKIVEVYDKSPEIPEIGFYITDSIKIALFDYYKARFPEKWKQISTKNESEIIKHILCDSLDLPSEACDVKTASPGYSVFISDPLAASPIQHFIESIGGDYNHRLKQESFLYKIPAAQVETLLERTEADGNSSADSLADQTTVKVKSLLKDGTTVRLVCQYDETSKMYNLWVHSSTSKKSRLALDEQFGAPTQRPLIFPKRIVPDFQGYGDNAASGIARIGNSYRIYGHNDKNKPRYLTLRDSGVVEGHDGLKLGVVEQTFLLSKEEIFEHFAVSLPDKYILTKHSSKHLELLDEKGIGGNVVIKLEHIRGGCEISGHNSKGEKQFLILREDGTFQGSGPNGALTETEQTFYNARGRICQFFKTELPAKHLLKLPDEKGNDGNVVEKIERIAGGYKIQGHDRNNKPHSIVLKNDGTSEGAATEFGKAIYRFRFQVF